MDEDLMGAQLDNLKSDEKDRLISELQRSLQEKEIFIHEIHHRVKNNLQIILSLLNLQKSNNHHKSIPDVIDEIKNKIFSIAAIHELLYQNDYHSVNLLRYFTRLVENLTQTYDYDPNHVHILFKDPNLNIEIGQAINLGLIVNELITNAIRHAFPPKKKASLSIQQHFESDNFLVIIISDDGIGLPNEIDVENSQSMGFRIVSLLVRQLKAKIYVERYKGTRFIIKVTIDI